MDVFSMQFSKVFPLLIAKAERKGRTRDDVFTVTTWMTGYNAEELEALLTGSKTYGEFLSEAPCPHWNHRLLWIAGNGSARNSLASAAAKTARA